MSAAGVLSGEATGDLFGRSAMRAGDVNGDGFADVIVGAFQNSAAGTGFGRAYVFFGAPGLSFDASADGVLTGTGGTNSRFGIAVGLAGDVNGDGFADVIGGAAFGSYAHLFLGGAGASLNPMADGIYVGSPGTSFGAWVAGLLRLGVEDYPFRG